MSDARRCGDPRSQASEVLEIALLQVYLLRHLQWDLANGNEFLNYSTVSKFDRAGFSILVIVFVYTLNLEGSLRLVRPQESFSDGKFFRF